MFPSQIYLGLCVGYVLPGLDRLTSGEGKYCFLFGSDFFWELGYLFASCYLFIHLPIRPGLRVRRSSALTDSGLFERSGLGEFFSLTASGLHRRLGFDLGHAGMRTRAGSCYPGPPGRGSKRRRGASAGPAGKRQRPRLNHFDAIPDDLAVSILARVSSSAGCPADFINLLLICKRFQALGAHPAVLQSAPARAFEVAASKWSESGHRFVKRFAEAGNVEACYTLGMISFYCLENRTGGAALMARAAMASHAPALYSLGIIQFNGSGGSKRDKDLRAGVVMCARAASLGHIDALREVGHCLQDGYGVAKNVAEGRRFLVQANARELASALPGHYWKSQCLRLRHSLEPWLKNLDAQHRSAVTLVESRRRALLAQIPGQVCPLLSDFGCSVPPPNLHPAIKFMVDWFALHPPAESGLRLCSHAGCGRPETRKHEFRRCSVCGFVNYCSRACQALDWKIRHKFYCMPHDAWFDPDDEDDDDADAEVAEEEGGLA